MGRLQRGHSSSFLIWPCSGRIYMHAKHINLCMGAAMQQHLEAHLLNEGMVHSFSSAENSPVYKVRPG